MSGKILIYGGVGGIGGAAATLLKRRGFELHLTGRDAARLAAAAGPLGASFTLADVDDPESFARVSAEAGPCLQGLIYAIGTINLKPFQRLTAVDYERDFRINAIGAASAVKAALPALKAGGQASIVLFSTVAVAMGFASHASVAMAKGAVEGLTRSLAAELAPAIRVNAIAPSLTKTPLAAAFTANPERCAALGAQHPLQRLGEAGDIAGLAAFLVSGDASWMTGQVIAMEGGRGRVQSKG